MLTRTELWEEIKRKKAKVEEGLTQTGPDSIAGLAVLLVDQADLTNRTVQELGTKVAGISAQIEDQKKSDKGAKETVEGVIQRHKTRLEELMKSVNELSNAVVKVSSTGLYVYLC